MCNRNQMFQVEKNEGWAGHVANMGERRGAYRVLVGKPEGRRPLGRIILKWISGSGMGGMDWIVLAQGRDRWWALVDIVTNLWVL